MGEQLPGGIKYLREVILEDKLGICAELEKQMQELIGTFFCEWTETINDPEKRKAFQQFANTNENREPAVEKVEERGQSRPAYWAKDSVHNDFKGTRWTSLTWQPMVEASRFADVETGSSTTLIRGDTQLAVFKLKGKYYATQQMCPHKRTFGMSDGINGEVDYESKDKGAGSCSNDASMSMAVFPAEEREDGLVYLKLPPVQELDAVLGTSKWVVKKEESTDPFTSVDRKLGLKKGLRAGKTIGSMTDSGKTAQVNAGLG